MKPAQRLSRNIPLWTGKYTAPDRDVLLRIIPAVAAHSRLMW